MGDVIVNVRVLVTRPSGLRTVTVTSAAAMMSAAPMPAVTCAALMNVVGRGAPFHSTVAPAPNPAPSIVTVKAAPPAAAFAGVRVVELGPLPVPSSRSMTGTPVACSAVTRSVTEAAGIAWRRTAMIPATWGAAIEVPLAAWKRPSGTDDTMALPGAKNVMNGAALVKDSTVLLLDVAPTLIVDEMHAGRLKASLVPELPAATTVGMPTERRLSTAALRTSSSQFEVKSPAPRLMFTAAKLIVLRWA